MRSLVTSGAVVKLQAALEPVRQPVWQKLSLLRELMLKQRTDDTLQLGFGWLFHGTRKLLQTASPNSGART